MNPVLPDYDPPAARRAAVAAGGAPVLVLVVFLLVVSRWLDPVAAVAWMVGSALWVVLELTRFQHAIDAYNLAYARQHLEWRSSEALRALAAAPGLSEPTRGFVQRFVDAERRVLRDGQMP